MRLALRLILAALILLLPEASKGGASDMQTIDGYMLELSEGSVTGSFHLTSQDFREGFEMQLDYFRTHINGKKVAQADNLTGRLVRVQYVGDNGNLTALRVMSLGTRHLASVP